MTDLKRAHLAVNLTLAVLLACLAVLLLTGTGRTTGTGRPARTVPACTTLLAPPAHGVCP